MQGVRKSGTKYGKTPGKPAGGLAQNAKPGLKPSEAPLMERVGAGAEAFEFRPPLAKTPQAAAAEAYAAVAEEAGRAEEAAHEDAPRDSAKTDDGRAEGTVDETVDVDAATKRRRRVSSEKADKTPACEGVETKETRKKTPPDPEKSSARDSEAVADDAPSDPAARKKKGKKKPVVGAAGWGDGDRELAGDKRVTNWLEFRGFGEFAAAFAARGVTLDALKTLTMSDLEDVPVEGAATREKIFAAAAEFAKDAAERAAKRAEKKASGPPKKKRKSGPSAAE